ncbi:MAG: 3-deoxy-D-manno-octulosonic acid kinase [Wenzhouxiangellaceae bacterium]
MDAILRFDRLLVRHDPERTPRPEPGWFDPDWWRTRHTARSLDGGRGAALAVDGPPGPAVLRHYRRGGWVARVNADRYLWTGLQRTRPWREWQVIRELWLAGLPVPQPLAAGVWRGYGPVYRGALLTARIHARSLTEGAGALSADDWFRLGRLVAAFADAGLAHPDLNAGNVLVDDDGGFWLIDFDRARLLDRRGPTRTMLARLTRSLRKQGLAHDPVALARGAAVG